MFLGKELMNRRNFIQLGLTGLVGCSSSKQASEDSTIQAGSFSISVPGNWNKTAIVEKVPIKPLYNAEDWELSQKDELFILKLAYDCRPQHWALRFPAALPKGIEFDPENAGCDPTAPQILIHKADEWGLVSTDGKNEGTKAEDVLLNLRKNMDDANLKGNQIESPDFGSARSTDCLKKRIDFRGGHGFRFIAQSMVDANLMRFGELHYLFVGLSDDNSCQIIASFPIDLPGLPKTGEENHLGYSIKNYEDFVKNYSKYVDDSEKWLEKNEHEITPSFMTLDRVIQSLVATKWE
jgi:hypothetical protein